MSPTASPGAATTLHLTNAYHPTSGGIRTFYRALLAGAEARGRRLHLVVPADRSEEETCGRYTSVHHVEASPAPGFDRRYRLLTPRHFLRRDAPVRRLMAALQPDVVEVCDKYTLVPEAWRIRRQGTARPTLVAFSCERMDHTVAAYFADARPVRAAVARYVRHVYLPAFDAHLANSAYTAEELHACGAPPAAVHLCGMGVDAAFFAGARRDESLRARLLAASGGTPSSALLLYAGRVSPEKHLDVLIDAVALLAPAAGGGRDVRLVIVGDGPETERLRRRAARVCPGRVCVVPHLGDRQLLAAHYASADVFVHPNPREPFGIGPLEAMAAGTPVVLPRAGGVLSYAWDGNAWLAAPGPQGLAHAVGSALAAGRAAARVARARRTALEHAWPRAVDRYFDVIDRVHAARVADSRPAGLHDATRPCLVPGR